MGGCEGLHLPVYAPGESLLTSEEAGDGARLLRWGFCAPDFRRADYVNRE